MGGTFAQYFEIASRQPSVAQLSHERIYSMIMAAGTETGPRVRPSISSSSDEIFGLEKPLQQIVEYFRSGAQRLEVRKRILLLMGPVGGGKSTIVTLLKRGLEEYTRTDDGAVYAIKGCPMHEEPLHLIPDELRPDIETEYGLYIEGDLCPKCRWLLENKYGGKIEDVPVVRIGLLREEPHRHRHLHAVRPQEPGHRRAGRRHRPRRRSARSASRATRAPTASTAN